MCFLGNKRGVVLVATRERKLVGGFDVWERSAAGEHIVMYLLKLRPLCLIQYICTPFPSFPPAAHSHVYRNNTTQDHKFPHSLSPLTFISLSIHAFFSVFRSFPQAFAFCLLHPKEITPPLYPFLFLT